MFTARGSPTGLFIICRKSKAHTNYRLCASHSICRWFLKRVRYICIWPPYVIYGSSSVPPKLFDRYSVIHGPLAATRCCARPSGPWNNNCAYNCLFSWWVRLQYIFQLSSLTRPAPWKLKKPKESPTNFKSSIIIIFGRNSSFITSRFLNSQQFIKKHLRP